MYLLIRNYETGHDEPLLSNTRTRIHAINDPKEQTDLRVHVSISWDVHVLVHHQKVGGNDCVKGVNKRLKTH